MLLKGLHSDKHQRHLSLVFIYLFFSVGVGSIAVGATSQVSPPRPAPASSPINMPSALDAIVKKPQPQYKSVSKAAPKAVSNVATTNLSASLPEKIFIPSIGITSTVIQVGKDSKNEVEVPRGNDYDKAAWYKHSVTPGEDGSSVILGHVDSAFTGPSIFFNLGALKVDDIIKVDRADGTTVEFKVDGVKEYLKDSFPTNEVYGNSKNSTLKLITCSGDFDQASGEYQSNIVVFASLMRK